MKDLLSLNKPDQYVIMNRTKLVPRRNDRGETYYENVTLNDYTIMFPFMSGSSCNEPVFRTKKKAREELDFQYKVNEGYFTNGKKFEV